MTYDRHVLKVVVGSASALLLYNLWPASLVTVVYVGALFLLSLFLAIDGLFTGIEAAVAAGTDRPVESDPTE
ncbi:hypothetical protein [Haloarchaeobius sp. HRN-SO-5]|uniref:hypothetical protein n=1 Tax=Haloarchaeobius sp. HRN-SO-5 TaxID=3446118 RepID=UPI003EBD9334